MHDYNYAHDLDNTIKSPCKVWEKQDSTKHNFRLVVVYSHSGTPPRIVLEKSYNVDAMGELVWERVDTSCVPDLLWRDIVVALGDDSVLCSQIVPSNSKKK